MTRRLVAGVDSSTQSCKVVVCDAETGEVVREGRAAHPDGTQVDAGEWWAAYGRATEGGLLDGVEALAVGGQQHGMVTLDEHDDLVRPAMLWNDVSAAQDAADLVAEIEPREWAEAVGSVPVASITVSKLRWLARNEPENADRVARVVLPHDWLTGRILAEHGERREWTTDRGDASGTGYWSPAQGAYRTDLVRTAFGRDLELPRVAAPHEAVGKLHDGMLLGPGTGDNMAAALGLSLEPGDVVVSLGTSGTVFAEHDRPVADPTGIIAGFASATGGHLPLACTLNAARVLVSGAALVGADLGQFDVLALEAEPGAGGLSLLPYLDGERTPNLPEATGTLSGMTRANSTPANLARAHVEGMIANLAECVDAVRRAGIPVGRVLLIGGASAAQSVQAVAARMFGVPVAVPEAGEYVARGAARQAAWVLSGDDTPPRWPARLAQTVDAVDCERSQRARERYAALREVMHPATRETAAD